MKETRTRGRAAWDCGVPMPQCSGASKTHNDRFRAHGSREEALRCGKRYARAFNESRKTDEPELLPPTPQRLKPGKGGRIMPPRIRG